MEERTAESKLAELHLERRRLAAEASRYEIYLIDPTLPAGDFEDAIEELRAMRMRIHAIDNLIKEMR